MLYREIHLLEGFVKNTPLRSCTIRASRPGIVDMWNAGMADGAVFSSGNDIPFCPSTATEIPRALIGYDEAKTIHNQNMCCGNRDYHVDAFIHFYIDDQKFDGKRSSIWLYPDPGVGDNPPFFRYYRS